MIDGIPIMLSHADAQLSLTSSREPDRAAGITEPKLRPDDLAARASGPGVWLRYAKGAARELLLFTYFSTRGFGRGRIRKTQLAVKQKHERRDLDAVNAYDSLTRRQLMLLDGRLVDATPAAIRSRIASHILAAAERVSATEVLEAGFGDGVNFWSLCKFHPTHRLKLTGFDYSFQRTRIAKRHASQHRRVSLFNGDGKNIALPDVSFDLAYTVHCLEHMPRDNVAVLRELSRVARYVLLIEPFFEQQTLAGKLHIARADYSRNLTRSVEEAGLSVLDFRPLGLGNPYNRSGLLLASSNPHSK